MAKSEEVRLRVCDRRCGHRRAVAQWLETRGLDFSAFRRDLSLRFSVPTHDRFVLVTAKRTVLDADKFKQLQNGSTLYMLEREDQALELATEEPINFTPHHDTVVESGTFKYYDSEGKKALPYALADLIDNALSATARNTGARTIEIRMLFDESLGKPAVIVLDNGCGMTSKHLNNWAVYKLSKFTRNDGSYFRPNPVPRSLNSDISYFGVGGKQAVFYIGKATRMISKQIDSPYVHELVLSKALFEEKAKNKEDTYSTTILNRKPGDYAHIDSTKERFLHHLIAEECNRESFTAVVITEVQQEHINFLREDFKAWTRQLAHIYHYYIHGVNGNLQKASITDPDQVSKIDILVTLHAKNLKSPYVCNLRDIKDDMQSLYIQAAVSTFEFKAFTNPGGGQVEGIVRYHPFLYNRETYPQDPDADNDDDEEDYNINSHALTKKKPVFECYWNGRLIPYTTVSEFEWCSLPPKGSKVPAECYSRFSGVLFTNDTFKVTENKLTFIDMEQKLKNKDTVFMCVVKGQKRRSVIQGDFTRWLQDCHARFDKQVKFLNYQQTITRTDVPTKREQHPWATFTSVEWDGNIYKTGQYVKSHKTSPIHNGTVVRFLLYGDHDRDQDGAVFAPGGQVEICLEPKGLYNKTKIIPLAKLDRNATVDDIKKNIQNDSERLPDELKVEWPYGNQWQDNSTHPAGTKLGPLRVDIMNKKGESLSTIPVVGQSSGKRLGVELKLVHNGPGRDKEVFYIVAPHTSKHGYWFKEIENVVELGRYTLHLNSLINENNTTEFGDKQLPYRQLRFTIKEGKADHFDVGTVSPNLRIGVPFEIPLEIKDSYGHPVEAPASSDIKPVLQCSGLEVTYNQVNCRGNVLMIRNVQARGKLLKYQEPNPFDMTITLDGLTNDSKTLRINLLPGNPHAIHVLPNDAPITVENGSSVQFTVMIQDEAGNITARPKMTVQCLVPDHSPASINCMTGVAQYSTKPINVSIVDGQPQTLNIQFKVSNRTSIKEVTRELLILPSKRVCRMELYKEDDLVLRDNEKIQWLAGGVLENLLFRLYDEANRKIPITADVASKIKVNWTGDMSQSDVIKGRLPDVQVPTKVEKHHFYQVSYQDQSVSVSFEIQPIPDEPAGLKAVLRVCTLKLGEILSESILLDLVDQYNNVTKTLTSSCVSDITAEGKGLDTSALAFTFQESSCSVLVTGVCFTGGTPGHRELNFNFRSFSCLVKLSVTAGAPAQLQLVNGPTQPLQILNGHGIPTPFLIQLCDKWGNPSIDKRVVVKLTHSPSELTVMSNVTSQPVNAAGQAAFRVNTVSGPKGYYQLNFKGIFNKEPIAGPSVNLTVFPDPNKPVSLDVQYDTSATFTAGELFPVFSVTVISDEGSPITSFNPTAMTMLQWKGVLSGKPPNTSVEFQCSKPKEPEKKDCFYFREKPIPKQIGKYTIQFCLRDPKNIDLHSHQIIINVVANQPVKLAPENPPETQVVSCSGDITKRTLVESMTLRIVDQYGNPTGQELSGKVKICIKNTESTEPLPLFEGKTDSLQMQLLDGKTHISRLAIMKNSPGEHGATYTVLFRPVLSTVTLAAYEFHFTFSNDAQKQQIITEQSRKRESLRATIQELTNRTAIFEEMFEQYSMIFQKSCNNEVAQRNELNRCNLNIQENASIESIDRIQKDKTNEEQRIFDAPRRTCGIHDPYSGAPDVLGVVGNLAWVKDDAAARVISWYIRGDMDCVITMTTEAARRIYDHTQGRQQVMPIDTINAYCRRPFPPLPHIKNGRKLFDPPGNPVYAVDVLIYSHRQEECEIVFRNIIGNTILIDDLDSANNYRRLVVQNNMSCATILTRQGDRVSCKGKFGGAQNKAPPMDQLGSAVFGAPFREDYHQLQRDIELLGQYRIALEKKLKSKVELDNVRNKMATNLKETEKQKEDLNKQLQEVERQLAIPLRPMKRVSADFGETSDITTKRPR